MARKNSKKRKFELKWIPIILGILYIIFISLFAFDTEIISWGFLIHLIPSLILIGILILSIKKPLVGGIAFIVVGLIFTIFFRAYREIYSFLAIIFPLIVIGVLFILTKEIKRKR
jgi:hypothetical protein